MELSDEFVVGLTVEQAWALLTDLERVAPCLPGAQLDEVEGDEYRGRVRVKVGPMTVDYKGVARFVSRDETAHVAELRAEGRETRGQGRAEATVKATLHEESPGSTKVQVETNLDVSGRVAQFGRGVIADVSTRLLGQFVENLERDLLSGAAHPATEPASGAAAPSAPEGTEGASTEARVPVQPPREAEPVRALSLLGPVLLKRLSPIALFGAFVVLVRRLRRRSANR